MKTRTQKRNASPFPSVCSSFFIARALSLSLVSSSTDTMHIEPNQKTGSMIAQTKKRNYQKSNFAVFVVELGLLARHSYKIPISEMAFADENTYMQCLARECVSVTVLFFTVSTCC